MTICYEDDNPEYSEIECGILSSIEGGSLGNTIREGRLEMIFDPSILIRAFRITIQITLPTIVASQPPELGQILPDPSATVMGLSGTDPVGTIVEEACQDTGPHWCCQNVILPTLGLTDDELEDVQDIGYGAVNIWIADRNFIFFDCKFNFRAWYHYRDHAGQHVTPEMIAPFVAATARNRLALLCVPPFAAYEGTQHNGEPDAACLESGRRPDEASRVAAHKVYDTKHIVHGHLSPLGDPEVLYAYAATMAYVQKSIAGRPGSSSSRQKTSSRSTDLNGLKSQTITCSAIIDASSKPY